MRLFFSLALLGLFTSFSAQETIAYPYNPDGDVDGAIASPDLLDLLGVYGGDFSPSEIQIDGVGLLQVIQDLQNQIGALQGEMLDANYVESTLTAHQQEIDDQQQDIEALQTENEALQTENASLTQQVQDLQNAGFLTEETDPIASSAGYSTFDGNYNSLSNKPTIPTNNNQLSNGAGYSTFDGNYNSLSNKPTIPTNNIQLTNGAGYLTQAQNLSRQEIFEMANNVRYVDLSNGNYNNLYMNRINSYWTGVDFSGSSLETTNWGGYWVAGENFWGMTYSPNYLYICNFTDANLRAASFQHCTFFGVNNFTNANLQDVDFSGVDFSGQEIWSGAYNIQTALNCPCADANNDNICD